jgi:DNA-binding transcriptional ArsR family regulator
MSSEIEADAPKANGGRRSSDEREFISPGDPHAIRALAHPVRLRLLELLVHAGTLTATQASDALGESPANCAFHLRTLAKYGYVEEAGGGRGRERPWRRTHVGLHFESVPGNSDYSAAVHALEDTLFAVLIDRARTALAGRGSWPEAWHGRLGEQEIITYLTPDEADQLLEDLIMLLSRYQDRLDHPERRPKDAIPVEILSLAYPLLHLPEVRPSGPVPADRQEPEGS